MRSAHGHGIVDEGSTVLCSSKSSAIRTKGGALVHGRRMCSKSKGMQRVQRDHGLWIEATTQYKHGVGLLFVWDPGAAMQRWAGQTELGHRAWRDSVDLPCAISSGRVAFRR